MLRGSCPNPKHSTIDLLRVERRKPSSECLYVVLRSIFSSINTISRSKENRTRRPLHLSPLDSKNKHSATRLYPAIFLSSCTAATRRAERDENFALGRFVTCSPLYSGSLYKDIEHAGESFQLMMKGLEAFWEGVGFCLLLFRVTCGVSFCAARNWRESVG